MVDDVVASAGKQLLKRRDNLSPGQVRQDLFDLLARQADRFSTGKIAFRNGDGSHLRLGNCYGRHRAREFLAFLKQIEAHVADDVAAGKSVHLILDNHCTHKAASVTRWLARRPHWHLHFTPTHASWLNQVERFFAKITNEAIRRGNFHSVAAFKGAIEYYLEAHNREPKPFRWTKSAETILAKTAKLFNELL